MKRILIDAHEDIAWNALSFGRDYTTSAYEIRQRERGMAVPEQAGYAMLGQTEWLLGRVALIFATIFTAPERFKTLLGERGIYATTQQALAAGIAQRDVYYRLAEADDSIYRLVRTQADLDTVLATWADDAPFEERLIGLVLLMEGGDPIVDPEQFEEWYAWGLRMVGPAWMSTRYSGGAYEPGGLTKQGHALLEVMASFNAVLDVSHMAVEAFHDAIEGYAGPIVATHSNPHRFCEGPRGLSDAQIEMLAERDGVIGVVGYNMFLKPGWQRGERVTDVPLYTLADAVDHICQVVGSVEHVGLGSDFDGMVGAQHTPDGIDTVMDLHKIAAPLAERGYTDAQIDAIFYGNWLRVLRQSLPEG